MKKWSIIFLFIPFCTIGQNIRDSIINAPVFTISYAAQLPAADLAKRFGYSNNIGFSGGIKTTKNLQFDLEGTFFFSQFVKETSMLEGLQTSTGDIINLHGTYANLLVFERGLTGTLNVGKIFPMIGPNPNSGIITKFGVGFMRHKVRIQSEGNNIPQLSKDKLPFYDRLTFGLTLKQYIGYQHLSSNRLTNFNIGIEIFEGFTQGMRDYQIDYMGPYRENRLDILVGLRLGWVVPVYKSAPNEYYVN